MKKSELKKELEIAKATLGLAMVALRLASKRFTSGGHVAKNSADHKTNIREDSFLKNGYLKMDEILKGSCQTKIQADKVEPKEETPLTDLANEVEIEKQANELVKHFRPLVNGWIKSSPFDDGTKILEEEGNGKIDQSFWKWSISNCNKAAIKVAIKHCELYNSGVVSGVNYEWSELIKSQLQKMISE